MKVMVLLRPPPPQSLSFISPHRFFFFSPLKPYSLSYLSHLSTSATLSSSLPYGPSLHKGSKPHIISPQDSDPLINQHNFTREFNLAALRVPSDHCFALESRIRGHLLNWPRIRNIARVIGDDVDDDVKEFVVSKNESNLVSLNRRVYGKCEGDGERLSGVLYRDELVRTFDAKGYVNFRNLAKLSRPKKRKSKGGVGGNEGTGKRGSVYVVEVEEEESGVEGDEMSGLLGDDFTGRKWRGSTRLLLLDERYSDKELDEMPVAIKAVFIEGGSEGMTPPIELVRCKLTLFYTYWQMNEILEALLPDGLIVPSAFETVGHIAHLNLRDEHNSYKKLIAKVVLDKNKPKIQTVVNKTDAIHNDYRTMQLEVLAGNHSLVTTVVENGLRFQVDLATVYWNSRLATERQRLLNCFTQDDIVCDVFAGVGPIAIAAAKRVRHVYANDLNPNAVDFLKKNCVINKLERKIEVRTEESVTADYDGESGWEDSNPSVFVVNSIRGGEGEFQVTNGYGTKAAQVMRLPEKIYKNLDSFNKCLRFTIPFPCLLILCICFIGLLGKMVLTSTLTLNYFFPVRGEMCSFQLCASHVCPASRLICCYWSSPDDKAILDSLLDFCNVD